MCIVVASTGNLVDVVFGDGDAALGKEGDDPFGVAVGQEVFQGSDLSAEFSIHGGM